MAKKPDATAKKLGVEEFHEIYQRFLERDNTHDDVGKLIDEVLRLRAPQRVFKKPTVEEVAAYCRERKNKIDAQQFVDHYSSNGWRVGRTAMKDWKAAVRTWEKNERNGWMGGKRNGQGRLGQDPRPGQELVPGSHDYSAYHLGQETNAPRSISSPHDCGADG